VTGAALGEVAERGHRERDDARFGDVAPGDAGSGPRALLGHARGQVLRPGDRQITRRGQAEQHSRGRGSHGRDISQALGGRLAADLDRPGPVPAEMPSFDQQVHGGHDTGVRGGQHRGVVADADDGARPLRHPGRQRRDEPELTQVRDGDTTLPYWRSGD
jgi:hypothetical protein